MKVDTDKTRTTTADTIDNIILNCGATLHAPNLVEVTGNAHISMNARLDAPKLRKVHGLTVGTEVVFPELEVTTGIVEIRNGSLQAPELIDSDRIELFPGGELYSPQLQTIRTLFIHQSAKLNARRLRQVTDILRVHQDAVYHNDSLLEVGCCDLRQYSTLTAAKLAKCADLYVEIGAALNAAIEEAGTIYLESDASIRLEELKTIHGDLGIGDGAVFDARNLRQIEGNLSCCANSNFKTCLELNTFVDPNAIRGARDIDPAAFVDATVPVAVSKPRAKI